MDTLPDEMLELVFEYVSTPELIGVCSYVCPRWKSLVERRTIILRENPDLKRVHSGIRHVMVTIFPTNILKMIQTFTSSMQFLSEITAHSATPLAREYMDALRMLPRLVHLDVFTRPRILEEHIAVVARRLHTFVANDNFMPGLLLALAAGCALTSLHMYGRASRSQPAAMAAFLRARAVHLVDLTLRCGDMLPGDYAVIGECVNLRCLRLYSCKRLTAEYVRVVCQPRKLRLLHVTGARRVKEAALGKMIADLPSCLEELVLSMSVFNNKHVPLVAKRVPGLRVLELWNCLLCQAGLVKLAMSLPMLEQLDVDLEVSDSRLRELARHPTLRWLRCMPLSEVSSLLKHQSVKPMWDIKGLHVVAAQAPIYHNYSRAEDENDSFRAALFYFWTRDLHLTPMTVAQEESLEPYSDCFFSPC